MDLDFLCTSNTILFQTINVQQFKVSEQTFSYCIEFHILHGTQ
jgi:hypothetical protein